jgi:hypothetical protein
MPREKDWLEGWFRSDLRHREVRVRPQVVIEELMPPAEHSSTERKQPRTPPNCTPKTNRRPSYRYFTLGSHGVIYPRILMQRG